MFISASKKLQKYGVEASQVLGMMFISAMLFGGNVEMSAQQSFYRITFVDKGPGSFVPGQPLYDVSIATYHPKSLARRNQLLFDPLLNERDRPIHEEYLAEIRSLNIRVYSPSNWNNCVIAELDSVQASTIGQLQFVESVKPTANIGYVIATEPENCGPVQPGLSRLQLDLLNAIPLIESGVGGSGVLVCMIDNGFEWQTMTSLMHADVVGSIDVIYGDSGVGSDPNEPQNQSAHGSSVFSVIGGWLPGEIVGSAPFASFLLAKSEDMRFEKRVEEDFMVTAVEWAERNGADILSASVGYYGFDSTQDAMRYEWLDGNTTFCARAYNLAAERGVMCVAAAGNSGPTDRTLITPADADSAITVGGCRDDRSWWPNSSTGPTADGRIKPDVAALSVQVPNQLPGNYVLSSAGTSLATPQISGCLALLKQLYPSLPPWTLRNALYASASALPEVGFRLGYGIPDVVLAARSLGTVKGPGVSPPTIVNGLTDKLVLCAIYSSIESSAILTFAESGIPAISASNVDSLWVQFPIPTSTFTSDTLHARITIANDAGPNAYPSDSTWFEIPRIVNVIPCGVRIPSSVVSVDGSETTRLLNTSPRNGSVYASPNPLLHQQRSVYVFGMSATTNTIRLVETSTGISLPIAWTRNADATVRIDVPVLLAGHYTIVYGSHSGHSSVQLIVL